MPTQSLRAVLLMLSSEGLPWSVASWQALTRMPGELWFTVNNNNMLDDSPSLMPISPSGMQIMILQAALPGPPSSVNDLGNGASTELLTRCLRLLVAPPYKSYMTSRHQLDEAFLGTSSLLKGEVVKFCHMILSLSWNQYCKAVSCDIHLMDSLYEMVTQSWIAFSAEGTKLTPAQIKSFIKDLHKLLKLYVCYDDKDCRTQVEQYLEDMVEMLHVSTSDKVIFCQVMNPKGAS
ncbi:hypothetical protein F5J12DRAFT_782305 [Pisolithus orientalis]|uniref:uncharacterized protein n=1 Tax=Pisolithus orientalis TaxID=936130 RepID=UPI002224A5DD|nr:uncharacterized protein F5J12DRAFT_782305 [Pisolithus orientalis]KAI6008898.1 hypothetical protein F5J12DRAFT_782305 [Pisolithus orientalis]